MFKSLNLKEGQKVIIKHNILEKGNYIEMKPCSNDFYELNLKEIQITLIYNLRNYFCLTKGDIISVRFNKI